LNKFSTDGQFKPNWHHLLSIKIKKPSCLLHDFDEVTLGCPAIFGNSKAEMSAAQQDHRNPWISLPTLRWVWLFSEKYIVEQLNLTTVSGYCQFNKLLLKFYKISAV
jgi:hypothetical protein